MEEESGRDGYYLERFLVILNTCYFFLRSLLSRLALSALELWTTLKELFGVYLLVVKASLRKNRKKKEEKVVRKSFKERIEQVLPALHMCNREMRTASEYMAKGMGLMAGYEGRQARFNVFHLRGGAPGGVRAEVWSDCGPLPIERRLYRDRLEITFVPPAPGVYTVLLASLGRPLPGSPFTVKVDEARFAPPFVSPTRTPVRSPRMGMGIIDFGDEEMLVKEDGSLVSMNRSRFACDQSNSNHRVVAPLDKNSSSKISSMIATPPSTKVSCPLKSSKDCAESAMSLTPPIIPKVRVEIASEPKPYPRHRFTGFKLSNYVTRQESIETLKCSRNIKKLITKFETSFHEVDNNRSNESKKPNNGITEGNASHVLPIIQLSEESFQEDESHQVSSIYIKSLNNSPNYSSATDTFEGTKRSNILKFNHDQNCTDIIGKPVKVNRSHSLNAYLERIATSFPNRERRVENLASDEANNFASLDMGIACPKVYRSTSLYDKPRNKINQYVDFRNRKNLLFVGDNSKSHRGKYAKDQQTNLKMKPELINNTSCTAESQRCNTDVHLTPSEPFRVDNKWSQKQDLKSSHLPYQPSNFTNKYLAHRININKYNSKSNGVNEFDISSSSAGNINTLGNIYTSPKSKANRSLNLLNDPTSSEEITPLVNINSSNDDFEIFLQQKVSFQNKATTGHIDKTSEIQRKSGGLSSSGCTEVRKKSGRLDLYRDSSSSSREDELLNDITEPNISFDMTLSSSDSEINLPLDEEDTSSPVISGNYFQKVDSAPRRPSITPYFETKRNESPIYFDRELDVVPCIDVSNYKHCREWNVTNIHGYKNDFAQFAIKQEWDQNESAFTGRSTPKSDGNRRHSDINISLGVGSNTDNFYSSFMSLNLPLNKSYNDISTNVKEEHSSLNNAKCDKTASGSLARSSLSLDEKKLIFCKFNRFCSSIGLKKNSRGSFTVNRQNMSVKNNDSEKTKFKFINKIGVSKKHKEFNQKLNVRCKSNYSTFHVVRNASETVNFVGKMKDYWNNINKSLGDRTNKEKQSSVGSVAPKIVSKNRDRFEKMGKVMDKFRSKTGDDYREKESSPRTRGEKKVKHPSRKSGQTTQDGPTSLSDAPSWKLSDFIDKTPKSPFARRREMSQYCDDSPQTLKNIFNIYEEERKTDSYDPNGYFNSSSSDTSNVVNKYSLTPETKRRACGSDDYRIGRFDRLLNREALLASLRSFDTESAYSKTFQEETNDGGAAATAGYDLQYPHVPLKHKKETRTSSTFTCKMAPLRIFNPSN